jgi:hypothetical protein
MTSACAPTTSCAVPCTIGGAPSGTCAGVTWTIQPWNVGSPFCCFQSNPGNGPQSPITLTFSAPISKITVTIADPTYPGNTMQAFAADGSLVGATSFTSNGQPGVYSQDVRSLSGSITQVLLTNDPNDYIAYDAVIEVEPDSLTVTCTPANVPRGSTVSCTAKDANGQVVSPIDWSFTSTNAAFAFSRSEAGVTGGWSGYMVVSGQVSAAASGGRTGATVVNVSPRTQGFDPANVQFNVQQKGNGIYGKDVNQQLRQVPVVFQDLGDTDSWITSQPPAAYFQKVPSGPNKDLYYSIDNPMSVRIDVAVNYLAMSSGSLWWKMQSANRTPKPGSTVPYCGQGDVAPLLTMVQQHEGALPHPYSHVSTLKPPYGSYIMSLLEELVLRASPVPNDLLPLVLEAEYKAPIISGIDTHNPQNNPVQLTCWFKPF